MTIVKTNNDGIEVSGHSGYAQLGSDIVCSFISTLIQSTYRYLIATGNKVKCEEKEAYYKIKYEKINDNGKNIIDEFKKLIKEVEKEYGLYIKGEFNESTR